MEKERARRTGETGPHGAPCPRVPVLLARAGGEGPRGAVTGPELVHAAARHEGRWYIMLPGAPGG